MCAGRTHAQGGRNGGWLHAAARLGVCAPSMRPAWLALWQRWWRQQLGICRLRGRAFGAIISCRVWGPGAQGRPVVLRHCLAMWSGIPCAAHLPPRRLFWRLAGISGGATIYMRSLPLAFCPFFGSVPLLPHSARSAHARGSTTAACSRGHACWNTRVGVVAGWASAMEILVAPQAITRLVLLKDVSL